jgi:hypothetical protein
LPLEGLDCGRWSNKVNWENRKYCALMESIPLYAVY